MGSINPALTVNTGSCVMRMTVTCMYGHRRRSHTDGSYLSASDIRVHIGLGELDDEIQTGVIWSSGTRELWPVSEVNTEIDFTEGTGQSWTAQCKRS